MNNQLTKLVTVAIIAFLFGVTCQRPAPVTFDHRNRMDFELHGRTQYKAGVEDGKAIGAALGEEAGWAKGAQAVLHDLSMMDQSTALSNAIEHVRMEVEP